MRDNDLDTHDPLSLDSINTSTLPSCLTTPSPSSPNRLLSVDPADVDPTIRTTSVFPSAACPWKVFRACSAEEDVLYVSRILISGPGIAFWAVMVPQRLKMAATSSGVVPFTKPDTSMTFPPATADAPLIDRDDPEDEVASRKARWAKGLREVLGAAGSRLRRAESEFCDSYRS